MFGRILLFVFCTLIPSLAFAQGNTVIYGNGCIAGQPCFLGVPMPRQTTGDTYVIDADGCESGQPCPWRGLRLPPINARPSGNIKLNHNRNFDGTTDVEWFNPTTGSRWDQHYDPARGVQSGHRKNGEFWTAPLVQPFGSAEPDSDLGFGESLPLNFVYQPSEHDLWLEKWWRTGGTMKEKAPESEESSVPRFEAQTLADYAREEAERRQRAMIGVVLSGMQPGLLVEAARAAARQQCAKEPDEAARAACMKDAERK